MTCDDAFPLLLERVDGEPPDRDRARLDKHLRVCEVCRARLAALREDERVLADAIPVSPPRGFERSLAATVWERAQGIERQRGLDRRLWTLVAAASCMAVAVALALGFEPALDAWKPVARALDALPAPAELVESLLRGLESLPVIPESVPMGRVSTAWLAAGAAAACAQLLLARRLLTRRGAR